MKIGFIVAKDEEECFDDYLYDLTPKKYLKNDVLHTDVAIAISIKESYPDVSVDIILPNEISLQRLKKNDVNFVMGYDCISQRLSDPYVRKFCGEKGYNDIRKIYSSPSAKIFPPLSFFEFIWAKDKYLSVFDRKKIPITSTILVDKFNIRKILNMIQKKKWDEFIIKPVESTISIGVGKFNLKKCLKDPLLLTDYFSKYQKIFSKFLIQENIKGFRQYGEIKTFWIQGKYSYSVNTVDRGEDNYTVKIVKNKKVLDECIKMGGQVMKALPKIKINDKNVDPVLVRLDFTCCMNNKKESPTNYFLNEIENQDAGSYTNFEHIKYPYVQVMADAFVKKARELEELKF
jgi:hypothetical protein